MQPYPKAIIFKRYFLRCILLRKEAGKLLFIRAFKSPSEDLKER
ncbi:hypothetical protein M23134_08325 [Microscilla marina ATCC 23134]|uniref:Uncharacterized protein n=1 Tax=Microscilla marina ATCC 23134 TaxID=313606 RepID=A1ZQK1_MICM2|nr:hypothetical protein M23134_08325 [Microscilla marina ATCC 23134]